MERLTRRDSVGQALLARGWEEKYKAHELIDILLECLAAYEDTGLTPEGMEAIKTSLMGKSFAEWVNAEERLPESPGRYLTVSAVPKYGVKVVDVLRFAGAWIWRGNLDIIVTHWMPLPEPPKEGK